LDCAIKNNEQLPSQWKSRATSTALIHWTRRRQHEYLALPIPSDQMQDLVPSTAPPPLPRWRMWLLPIGLGISVVLLFNLGQKGTTPRDFTYTSFVK
jgi:hypothetical protein